MQFYMFLVPPLADTDLQAPEMCTDWIVWDISTVLSIKIQFSVSENTSLVTGKSWV